MKKKIRKIYFDAMKEEDWLNTMAARGLALVDYNFATYTFEHSRPGEYTYRLELLDNMASHPESQNYLEFLEDSDIEVVATYTWWAFLRKKTETGPFELYTDNASRIAQMKKLSKLWLSLGLMELFIGLINITISLWPRYDNPISYVNLASGLVLLVLAALFFLMHSRYHRNLKRLQKEGDIQES